MPLARILVFVLALTHVVGLADLVVEDEQACTDDGCKDCLPDAACRCHCPSAMPIVQVPTTALAVGPSSGSYVAFSALARAHASPDPGEILHVPRLGA